MAEEKADQAEETTPDAVLEAKGWHCLRRKANRLNSKERPGKCVF